MTIILKFKYFKKVTLALLYSIFFNLEQTKMKIWKLCPQGAVRDEGVREG
jgi:hypothetical protein